MTDAPRLRLRELRFYERHVQLRMPFRFGVVTLREAPQVFVRATIESAGKVATGQAAELLAPKWFDKDPALSNEQNFDQLRQSLAIARSLYLAQDAAAPAFGLHAAIEPAHYEACAGQGLNRLIASFGTALVDRAILDALCRAHGISVFSAVAANLPAIDAATAPDLAGFDLTRFLATLEPAPSIDVRHTVGLVDAITETDIAPDARLDDGLPESLEAVIARYGHRWFKLKVGGDLAADIERLSRIAAVLDRIGGDYHVSLDGNEQYGDQAAVLALMRGIAETPALARLFASIRYVEQPIARAHALDEPIDALAAVRPVAIDESDADIDVFPRARALGYHGISSKSCKGFYRSLLNRARAGKWNAETPGAGAFLTAEDLTTQAGIAVQQDFALATLIGCTHVERNGHHYVDGMAGAPEQEQSAFLAAHPDLYERSRGRARLRIENGRAAIASLETPGLGVAPEPDWSAMAEKEYVA